jgi:hypothetical protein
MYVQFSESLPGLILDDKNRSVKIDSSKFLAGADEFYAKYLAADVDYFAISPERARGFYSFLEALKESGAKFPFLKGQVVGPASFGLSVADDQKRASIYNTDIFEAVVRLLSMKAAWQVKKMKEFADEVIIFIDEPYLVSIGSSYINIDAEKAMRAIDDVAGSIRHAGALAGLHCCGNTDWQLLLKRDIDILSFDAYNFIKQFILFKDEIKDFLKRGGSIAWGIVPTHEADLKKVARDDLLVMLEGGLKSVETGVERASSLVTPSCGTGTLSEPAAERIFGLTVEIADSLKNK